MWSMVQEGLNPIKAIQMATINTARYFRLDHELGTAAGKYADMLLISDLTNVAVKQVFIVGKLVAEEGKCFFRSPNGLLLMSKTPSGFPASLRHRISISAPTGAHEATVRAIQNEEAQVTTGEQLRTAPVINGKLQADPKMTWQKCRI